LDQVENPLDAHKLLILKQLTIQNLKAPSLMNTKKMIDIKQGNQNLSNSRTKKTPKARSQKLKDRSIQVIVLKTKRNQVTKLKKKKKNQKF